jgi:hypothetical protein
MKESSLRLYGIAPEYRQTEVKCLDFAQFLTPGCAPNRPARLIVYFGIRCWVLRWA